MGLLGTLGTHNNARENLPVTSALGKLIMVQSSLQAFFCCDTGIRRVGSSLQASG
jgi:hypothetical protein